MTSVTVQETQLPSTTTASTTSMSPLPKLRQIAPAPTGKPDYDVYHIPKGYEVFLVSKNNPDHPDNSNAADTSPIPLSPTCSISSSSSTCSSSSPKIDAPKPTSDNNKNQSSWRKRKNNGHIPRPKNCFMAYREHMQHKVLAENPGMNNKLVSVIAAQMWNNEPEEVKQLWRERAQQLKMEHMIKYPNYKFAPRKKTQKNLNSVNPNGLKTPKGISKRSSAVSSKILNEEFTRSLFMRRGNSDNFSQSINYSAQNENHIPWSGHCRSSSVESVSSWTSGDSLPGTPPTFASPLRYETNDWNRIYELNEFSSLNSSPHLTAVSVSNSGFYDTLLPPPMLTTDYDNSMQIDDSTDSPYYLPEDNDDLDQYEKYESFIQPDNTQLLNTFVLPSQQHQLY